MANSILTCVILWTFECKKFKYRAVLFQTILFFMVFVSIPIRSHSASGIAPQVTLTIVPSRDRVPISSYIYGLNIANWSPWYYMHMLEERIREARIEVVRLGATNMERYNFRNNRMYNVISRQNDYVPLSWESFVQWVIHDLKAEPFLQVSVFGHVASDAAGPWEADYSHTQSSEELTNWVTSAAGNVRFWGIGNEPFIAWKRNDYPPSYSDSAHGDQVLNFQTSYDHYFERFSTVADAIKGADPLSQILGPTSANWWFYWFNDYSPICPVTQPNGEAQPDAPAWRIMTATESTWNSEIFPDRGEAPDIVGWENDPQKIVPYYLNQMQLQEADRGERLAEYLDVHRYIRCITERDAILEPRGLFQETFESWDMETLFSGVKTNILNRFNSAVDRYYPGTKLSFSEYGYFYWDGYPSIPQVAAIGTMDYLGFFARAGVHLACNWYLGEPNQSGADLTHAVLDSARQAMFDEQGEPNPKYWALYLMSNLFRGTSIRAEASDWDTFSVHACETSSGEVVVFAVNKGSYDPKTGEFLTGQPPVSARIQLMPDNGGQSSSVMTTEAETPLPVLSRLFRYGLDDPHVIAMDPGQIAVGADGSLIFDFHPLSIYGFIFSSKSSDPGSSSFLEVTDSLTINGISIVEMSDGDVEVTPDNLDFGPYSTGWRLDKALKQLTHGVKITSTTLRSIPWTAQVNVPWITIEGPLNGEASITDTVYLTVNRNGLETGVHTGEVMVETPGFEKTIPVTLTVLPGETDGEKRIADFETGSLAHTLSVSPPYSIGWWDAHGAPNDRNSPYLYNFYLDENESNRLGSRYCMRIDFDRRNGDTDSGKNFQSFGTYGHEGATSLWEGFDAFEFDIKTETAGTNRTALLMIITDAAGHKGKPAFDLEIKATSSATPSLNGYTEPLMIQDGPWQTIRIPLNGRFFDWRYPEGQNGAETPMDFSAITQIEFVPWDGEANRRGWIYLDNLRLTGPNEMLNRLPVAVIDTIRMTVKPGDSITLKGLSSYDQNSDGAITAWQWLPGNSQSEAMAMSSASVSAPGTVSNEPADGAAESTVIYLSDPFSSTPIFSAPQEGIYLYDLIVTDDSGEKSRNIAQVRILVSQDGNSETDGTVSSGGGASGEGCFCSTLLAADIVEQDSVTFSIRFWMIFVAVMMILYFAITIRRDHLS